MDSVTTFNVSGQLFSTSTDTLLREPSSRLAAIARKSVPCIRDNQGNFFLDRDPRWFQLILNHLRDGWCSLPSSQREQEELLQEIRHYQLVGFEAFLRSQELTGKHVASTGQVGMGGREAGHPAAPVRTRSLAFSPSTVQHSPYIHSHPSPSVPHQPQPTHPSSPIHSHGNHTPTRHSQLPSQYFPEASRVPHFGDSSTVRHRQSPSFPAQFGHAVTGAAAAAAGDAAIQGQSGGRPSVRSVFMQATGPPAAHTQTAAYSIPPDAGAFKRSSPAPHGASSLAGTATAASGQMPGAEGNWTSKYLRNDGLRDCVNTLLALAFLPPHASLHGGKIHLSITVPCDHARPVAQAGSLSSAAGYTSATAGGVYNSATAGGGSGGYTGGSSSGHVPGATSEEQLRRKHQVVRVKGPGGSWNFEFGIGPNSDQGLFEQYQIAEYCHDNWFVLGAVLKSQFGILMEEDTSSRPTCLACRRINLALFMQKIY